MYYDYLIVGAGLFGSVFAHEMKKRGKRCLVIEKREHIGGNIYTETCAGIQVHRYGAHIFHTSDKAVWDYIGQFAEWNHYINSPIAIYKEELYNLPFNMNTFSKLWGIRTPQEAKAKIAEQIAEAFGEKSGGEEADGKGERKREPRNLEEQALFLVGRDVYEKLIKGYTEKQWGRDCKELPAFIIRRLPLRFTYDNNYFNDPYQGIPKGGYTRIIERLLEGIEVRTGVSWQKFQAAHEGIAYGKVLYTGMIDEYFGYGLGALEYRSLRFETEYLPDCDNYQGNAVVNYTEREIPYTRIIEHKHFEFGTGKGTVITREYPAEWKKGDAPYYPINNEENNRQYEEYKKLAAREKNVLFGGRLGQYRYYDMDKTISEALKLVQSES